MDITLCIRTYLDAVISSFSSWRKIEGCDVITDDCDNYLQFYPEILNYVVSGEEVYELWIACKFQDLDLELSSQLVVHFKKMSIEPLTCENNFIKKFFAVESGYCICYFNPKYIKGLKVKEIL